MSLFREVVINLTKSHTIIPTFIVSMTGGFTYLQSKKLAELEHKRLRGEFQILEKVKPENIHFNYGDIIYPPF